MIGVSPVLSPIVGDKMKVFETGVFIKLLYIVCLLHNETP